MNEPKGIIVYSGKSQFDGRQILAIATGFKTKSENEKTGDMIPIWIIRKDIPPILAAKLGFNFCVCGNCKHVHLNSCYVNLVHAPERVFQGYHNDRYTKYTPDMQHFFEGKNIRLGAYGDPAAIPMKVWDTICKGAAGWTGYSHQWENEKIDARLREYCMASCDTMEEQARATQLGWRTFRIRTSDEQISQTEFMCPASIEAGKKTTCSSCKACMGIISKIPKSPCIIVHGAEFKVNNFIRGRKKMKNKKKWKINFKKRYESIITVS